MRALETTRIVSERRSIRIVNGLLLGKDMVDPHRVSECLHIQSRFPVPATKKHLARD